MREGGGACAAHWFVHTRVELSPRPTHSSECRDGRACSLAWRGVAAIRATAGVRDPTPPRPAQGTRPISAPAPPRLAYLSISECAGGLALGMGPT